MSQVPYREVMNVISIIPKLDKGHEGFYGDEGLINAVLSHSEPHPCVGMAH
jgi:hypothetical protein